MAAIELARESASSREYPVDVAAWDRLMDTAVVFAPVLRSRLDRGDGPSQPFTAHLLPRSNGKPRLKCGPSPEDAALQQYVLGELLRPHSSNTYLRAIPAVRWWPSTRQVLTTGRGDGDAPSVSFAYQVDMEALESRPEAVLIRPAFGVQEAKRGDFDIQTQISELFEALGDVISRDRRVVVEQTTWRITLLGWVVAVGVLTGALPTRFSHLGEERSVRPSLPQLPAASGSPEALADFAQRLLNLSSGFVDPEPHWPWGLFDSVDSRIWLTGREVLAITLRDSGLRFLRRRETSRFLTQDLGGRYAFKTPSSASFCCSPSNML